MVVVVLFFYGRAQDRSGLSAAIERKHTLNLCQVYALGYQQRHPDWTRSPWTECQSLMKEVFGAPEPSLLEAARRNPKALLVHILWNASLIPDGLQVLFFGATSGRVSPEFFPIKDVSRWVLWMSFAALAVFVMGGFRLWAFRRYWWNCWLKERIWVWLTLGSLSLTSAVVVLTEWPRPEYMFIVGITIRAALGMTTFALLAPRRPQLPNLSWVLPVGALLLILFFPAFYYQAAHSSPRPLFKSYRRLVPSEGVFQSPGTTLVTAAYGSELCNYLSKGNACNALSFADLRAAVRPGHPLSEVLDEKGVNLFFADETILADPIGRDFVLSAASLGWSKIGRDDADEKWILLQKNAGHSATP